MAIVRRFPALIRVLAVVLALMVSACSGTAPAPSPTPTTAPTSPPTSPPSSPSPSPTASPTSTPRPTPPQWAKPIVEPLAPNDIPTSRLVPTGAQAGDRQTVPASGEVLDQIVVTWSEGSGPFQQAHGLAIWQRFPDAPAWSVVYSFVDEIAAGVLGIRVELGDLTGDGHEDVLSFESLGGSGACGVWRVIAAQGEVTAEIYKQQTCDTQVEIDAGTLVVTESVYAPGDSHCCPSKLPDHDAAVERRDVGRREPCGDAGLIGGPATLRPGAGCLAATSRRRSSQACGSRAPARG